MSAIRCDSDELIEHVVERSGAVDRYLLGLVGPPGVGKSTLADRLAVELDATVAPMDGFHFDNTVLDARGQRHRKGAPHTFDAAAFVDAVCRVRDAAEDVEWPTFDRVLDAPVPAGVTVRADARLIVVEGNYLLLDEPPWQRLADLFDDVAYLDLDRDIRRERLISRHVGFGRTRADAVAHVDHSDEPNARRIEATQQRATFVVDVSGIPRR